MKKQPHIAPLSEDEVNIMYDWVKAEGWNPGLHDARTLYKAAHGGLLGIKIDEELVGVSAAFLHNYQFAYFGLYIVKPEYRGQGYGITMTRHRLKMAGYRNIALDGVMEHYQTYRRAGFRVAHRTPRYVFTQANAFQPSDQIQKISDVTLIELLDYEKRLFPCRRKAYLKAWVTQEGASGFCFRDDEGIKGFGMIRPCVTGYKIGPLFADSSEIARQLMIALLSEAKGHPVFCDIPQTNEAGLLLAEELGGQVTDFESARMYRGYQPLLDHSRIFGLTSLEAG